MIMGRTLAFLCLVLAPALPAAAEYKPGELELAPEGKIECSWSKLKNKEYALCQERKKFFGKMTEEERKKYNEGVLKRRTERRLQRIERAIPGVPVGQ
jgi:hypothetical protein